MIDQNDGGYKSRKMIMMYVVMVLGTIGFLAVARWPALAVLFPEYCMFLLGASSLYVSGNAAVKWMSLKASSKAKAPAPE